MGAVISVGISARLKRTAKMMPNTFKTFFIRKNLPFKTHLKHTINWGASQEKETVMTCVVTVAMIAYLEEERRCDIC